MGLLAMAVLLQLQAAMPVATQTLEAPLPAGFKVGFSAAQGGQTLEERVPAAETVEDWTRMITVQRFDGMARIGAHAFLDRLAALMSEACPNAVVAPVTDESAAHQAATVRVDCPRNPATVKPETMFARVLTGGADLHSVQYAYRSVPGAREVAVATAYLASVRLVPAGR